MQCYYQINVAELGPPERVQAPCHIREIVRVKSDVTSVHNGRQTTQHPSVGRWRYTIIQLQFDTLLSDSQPLNLSKFTRINNWRRNEISVRRFYPNVTMLRSGICYLLSQIRPSVCNVGAPYSGVEPFGNISSPLCTMAILWPPCKNLWRSSKGNPSIGGVKRKRGIAIYVMFRYLCSSWTGFQMLQSQLQVGEINSFL